MPRIRALKDPKEIARIPMDKQVIIDLSPEPHKEVVVGKENREGEVNDTTDQSRINDKTIGYDVTAREPPEKSDKRRKAEPEETDVSEFQKRIKSLEDAEQRYKDDLAARDTELANHRSEQERLRRENEGFQREVRTSKEAASQAEYDSVVNALGAAQAEAEAAQAAYMQAELDGDIKAKGDAQRRISRAEAQTVALEGGKISLEQRQEEAKARRAEEDAKPKSQPNPKYDDALARLPPRAQTWIRAHPEFFNDAGKNAKIQAVHNYMLTVDGIQEFSDKYYDELEIRLGLKQAQNKSRTDDMDDEDDEESDREAALSSAPVVRDPPPARGGERESNTRVTLSPAQRQAAKDAGITEVEYAQNLLKLRALKKEGHYAET